MTLVGTKVTAQGGRAGAPVGPRIDAPTELGDERVTADGQPAGNHEGMDESFLPAVILGCVGVLALVAGAAVLVLLVVVVSPLILLGVVAGLLIAWLSWRRRGAFHDALIEATRWVVGTTNDVVREVRGHGTRSEQAPEQPAQPAAEEPAAPAPAFFDPLTTLPNRALLVDRLEQSLARAARHRRAVAVLFMDIDNFKEINDTYGHAAGDHLLISIAAVLQAALRANDTAARIGGDEFVVVLEDVQDAHEARRAAERLLQALSVPFSYSDRRIDVSVSIGVALGTSRDDRPEALIQQADLALYRAKRSGKARIEVFDEELNREVQERRELEQELRQAVERREFRVFYQPKVLLETGRIVGLEALLRWEHPTKGLVLPAKFIDLAEETGLIQAIGSWVIRQACEQARDLQHGNLTAVVSVNLSARQFRQPDLVDQIAAALKRVGLNPASLALEIPEAVIIERRDSARATLQALKRLGVRIVVDDFGTSYASLQLLKDLPIDFVKLDRSLMANVGRDPQATAIVSTMITVGHALGLKIVAEGVETAQQAAWLRELRCDYAQGFYYGKPTAGSVATVLLAQQA